MFTDRVVPYLFQSSSTLPVGSSASSPPSRWWSGRTAATFSPGATGVTCSGAVESERNWRATGTSCTYEFRLVAVGTTTQERRSILKCSPRRPSRASDFRSFMQRRSALLDSRAGGLAVSIATRVVDKLWWAKMASAVARFCFQSIVSFHEILLVIHHWHLFSGADAPINCFLTDNDVESLALSRAFCEVCQTAIQNTE